MCRFISQYAQCRHCISLLLVFVFVVLWIESRTLHMLGKHCTTELYPQDSPSIPFESGSYVAQAGFEFMILLHQPLECWPPNPFYFETRSH
jgi:hypothetical protein